MNVLFPHDSIRNIQKEFVEDLISSLKNKKHLLAHAPTGLGKCVSGNTKILTDNGLEEIVDLYKKEVELNSLSQSKIKTELKKGFINDNKFPKFKYFKG